MTSTSIPHRAGIYLALVQLLFTLGWTVYAIFLPRLAAEVGISRTAVIFILMLDQAIFTVTDVTMGIAADRVSNLVGRLGYWVAAVTALSCIAFLALPFVAGVGSSAQPWFLGLTVLWAVTSSALRAPPLMLLGKYAAASHTVSVEPRDAWLRSRRSRRAILNCHAPQPRPAPALRTIQHGAAADGSGTCERGARAGPASCGEPRRGFACSEQA
jgi:MFS family permease